MRNKNSTDIKIILFYPPGKIINYFCISTIANLSSMLPLLVVITIATLLAGYIKKRNDAYAARLEHARTLKEDGDAQGAADAYLAILEHEYSKKVVDCSRITHCTEKVLPLLRRSGRYADEKCVLEMALRLCITVTKKDVWERWQRRILELEAEGF